jgi:hypothetical protein
MDTVTVIRETTLRYSYDPTDAELGRFDGLRTEANTALARLDEMIRQWGGKPLGVAIDAKYPGNHGCLPPVSVSATMDD